MNRKRQKVGQVEKEANANASSLPPVAGIITSLTNNSPYPASLERLWRKSLLPLEQEKMIDEYVLTRGELIHQLRCFKQPITLFGEDDNMRLLRFRNLLKSGHLHADPKNQNSLPLDLVKSKRSNKSACLHSHNKSKKKGTDGVDDDGLGACNGGDVRTSEGVEGMIPYLELDAEHEFMKTHFDELPGEHKIVVFFKQLLKEWACELQRRPESEKRTDKGRSNDATLEQCAQNLAPLFSMCRKRTLPADMTQALLIIVANCLQKDYLAAMDQYIKLALCNAPCSIGVTMVDIQERAAREKSSPNTSTETMHEETLHKCLQSVKRLMTLCQRRYPALLAKPVEGNGVSNGNGFANGIGTQSISQQGVFKTRNHLSKSVCISQQGVLKTGNHMRGSVSANSISLNGSVV